MEQDSNLEKKKDPCTEVCIWPRSYVFYQDSKSKRINSIVIKYKLFASMIYDATFQSVKW